MLLVPLIGKVDETGARPISAMILFVSEGEEKKRRNFL